MTSEPTTIKNPVEWGAENMSEAAASLSAAAHALRRDGREFDDRPIAIRRIGFDDLKAALEDGFEDFVELRSDVLAIGLIYPLAGLVAFQVAFNASLIPLLFPLIAGFALIGPFAALGLYEASRRRERGEYVRWSAVADAFASPSAGAIWTLGLMLAGLFVVWIATAWMIHAAIMGPAPASLGDFARDVLTTRGGQLMTIVGCAVGAVFALAALCLSAISFPLLLDRKVRLGKAIDASTRAVMENLPVMLTWGAIVAGLLALGALPALLGLIVVMPVLGHATWRLYRRVVR